MKFKPGVLSGDEVTEVLNDAKAHGYALPAVNVISTNSVNAVLETARDLNSPVVVQFSNGGGAFYAGKGLDNKNQEAAVLLPLPLLLPGFLLLLPAGFLILVEPVVDGADTIETTFGAGGVPP